MDVKSVCFIKPDLDTVCACWLWGLNRNHVNFIELNEEAPESILADTHFLCLECGGSGRVNEYNFDHHADDFLPCAAAQTADFLNCTVHNGLVQYISSIDVPQSVQTAPFEEERIPTLSYLFSGMRYFYQGDKKTQFFAGLDLLDAWDKENCIPNNISTLIQHNFMARQYYAARKNAEQLLENYSKKITVKKHKGYLIGLLYAPVAGVHGLLKRKGIDISIAYGLPEKKCFSISFPQELREKLPSFCRLLNSMDYGWGGSAGGSILASPRRGSRLSPEQIVSLLISWLDKL